MGEIRSEARLAGYLKRILPDGLWFACIGSLAVILGGLPQTPTFLFDPASLVKFALIMLAIGFVAAVLRDAWN